MALLEEKGRKGRKGREREETEERRENREVRREKGIGRNKREKAIEKAQTSNSDSVKL